MTLDNLIAGLAHLDPTEITRARSVSIFERAVWNIIHENHGPVSELLTTLSDMGKETHGIVLLFALHCAIHALQAECGQNVSFSEVNEACAELATDFTAFYRQGRQK